ncbi:hypothetical protein M3Y96_00736300 [Aphelenchoides besseyi]|nr:hypothetical protein M3Y96_00736300 [Aphelenchoides besseyi]
MVDPNELSRTLVQLAASSNFNMPNGIPAVGAARTNNPEIDMPFLAQPLFPFPFILQHLASQQLMPPTTGAASTMPAISMPSVEFNSTSVQQTANVQIPMEANSPLTNETARFHGRHSIWRHFEVQRDKSVYRCQVPGCTATYTWPPSTTVAGRHLRDKHANVYAQVLNDEADRRNRKRVIEVASVQQKTDGNRSNESGSARHSFDATLSPPSTTAGEPSPPPFIMEPSLKRARYDEEFFARLGILHHDDASFLPPSSAPISPLDSAISKKETEGEMREKIKRLEESMAELQSQMKRIGNELQETKALFNAECRTSQSMTVRLERDSEARV